VTIRNRCEATGFVQDERGVTISARDLDGGAETTVRARYLVGCDGGRSLVRKSIGAVFAGTPVIQRVQSTYIRAPKLLGLVRAERAGAATRATRAAAASASRSTARRRGSSTTT
jgi:2-polyprenyl-6-methoxyphenol hydroxylase-like FAD-dependent oxidoreductase